MFNIKPNLAQRAKSLCGTTHSQNINDNPIDNTQTFNINLHYQKRKVRRQKKIKNIFISRNFFWPYPVVGFVFRFILIFKIFKH